MNVINASQNVMCAVGTVVLIQEKLSGFVLVGIALTIAGLSLLGWPAESSVEKASGSG